MKNHLSAPARILSLLIPFLALLFPAITRAGNYTNFDVAIYIPVGDPNAAGYPQTFIAETPAPEPWPLLMFGTGLMVLWGGRKLKAVHN